MRRIRRDLALMTEKRFDSEQGSLSFFCQFPGASAGTTFERATNVRAHGIDATDESTGRFNAQRNAMTIFDLHEATIAEEMRQCSRGIVHAVVIDTEHANVFGQRGEAACAAEKAIGGD